MESQMHMKWEPTPMSDTPSHMQTHREEGDGGKKYEVGQSHDS